MTFWPTFQPMHSDCCRPAHCCPSSPPCCPHPHRDCEEISVKVLGCDACGNLVLSVKRSQNHCCDNDAWTPCKRFH